MQDYHDLLVWKRAFEFTKLTYRLTKLFPKDELYGLTSQFRRAAVSVSANIVEGRGKPTTKDFIKFLYITKGSLNECQFYLELAEALEYINREQFIFMLRKVSEVGFLLQKFILSLHS
jgi:four helix bundle protein